MAGLNDGTAPRNFAGVALWRQIADDLERAIVQGELPTGARLPGEVDIAERFAVNRHTVRRALAELSSRGLVRAARGSGTYVETSRLPYPINAHTRFSEIVGAAGRQAGGRLVGSATEEASEHIAAAAADRAGHARDPSRDPAQRRSHADLDRHDLAAGGARAEGRAVLSGDALDHAHARALRHHRLPAA